ncbi:class I SAM-dependent methyltransferase [Deinococcus malanensis]|uniref:class I SAM-dependent methyltransferase n=1 Tax=Deinococcus malanensis TaxID=1706855 RepID=UPI0016674F7A|nr:class I SAM-dependent methyltransferase [Deinococcus malanensis]
MDAALRFYDEFADQYKLIFDNWIAAVRRQADILAPFLRGQGIQPGATVLDCACGIGTQAYGLASKGYQVTATDLSPRSIERAITAAVHFDAPPQFKTADSTPRHSSRPLISEPWQPMSTVNSTRLWPSTTPSPPPHGRRAENRVHELSSGFQVVPISIIFCSSLWPAVEMLKTWWWRFIPHFSN